MTAALSLRGVTARYGRLTAVDGVDLSVQAGTCHCVVGPNGAGKSSLAAVISGALRPVAGHVELAGHDITRTTPARRSRLGLSRTFQTPQLWPDLTAFENVQLGAARHVPRPRMAHAAARAVQLLDQVGLGDCTGVSVARLAHGQRRLVDIAVALAGRPSLLVLDEPTAGLADQDIDRLTALLRTLLAEVAMVLIEHRLDVVAMLAREVTVMHQGRVLAQGTMAEVAADPEVQTQYPILGGAS